jgi:hypothetical protein
MRLFFLIALFSVATIACSSKHNVVRLSKDKKLNNDYLTLSTEHYLSLDGDRILELDRGERTLTLTFRRPAALTRPENDVVSLALKLYDTDPAPKGKIRLEANGSSLEFEPQNVTKEVFSETVTVLDTGQRQLDNPSLANSAQAQTGYITFGKPATAGAAQRSWHIYRVEILPESAVFDKVRASKRAVISVTAGRFQAEAQVAEKELSIWKKYASGEYDEKGEP